MNKASIDSLPAFILVHFTDEEGCFDMVPKSWIEVNNTGKLVCPFFENHDTSKKETNRRGVECQMLVKSSQPPLANWKKYPIEIRGCGKSFKDAEKRLEQLREDTYGVTTEDSDPEDTVKKMTEIYKKNYEKRNNDDIDNLLTKAVLLHESTDDLSDTGSTNDESTQCKRTQRKRKADSLSNSSSQSSADEAITPKRRKTSNNINITESNNKITSNNSTPVRHMSGHRMITPTTTSATNNENPARQDASKSQLYSNNKLVTILEKLIKIENDQKMFRKEVSNELKMLHTKINTINTTSQTAVEISTKNSLIKNYYCETVAQFDLFDENLRSDKILNNKIRLSMVKFVDTSIPVQRSIGDILKQIMSKEVLFNFTAQKATKEKPRVFVKTQIWKCIEETIVAEWEKENLPSLKEKDLLKAVGLAINASRDWLRKKNQRCEPIIVKEIPDIDREIIQVEPAISDNENA